MCSYCWAKSGLRSVKYLALLSSNTTSDPETHKVRHVGQHEDIGILVALGLTTHIETRLDFQTYPKKRFRKSDFQCHSCSFFTLVTLKNTNGIIRLRLIKARGEPGSEQGKTHSGGATTPSASPGKKSLQPYRRKQKHCKRQCKGLAAIQCKDLLDPFCEQRQETSQCWPPV